MIRDALCVFSGAANCDVAFFETIDKAAMEAGLRFFVYTEDESDTRSVLAEPSLKHPWRTPAGRARDVSAGKQVYLDYALESSDRISSITIDIPAQSQFTAGSRLRFECYRLGRFRIWDGDFERELDYWLRVEHVLRAFHQRYPVSIWISHDKVPHDLILLSGEAPPPLPCVWPTSQLLKEVRLDPEEVRIVDKDLCELEEHEFPCRWRPFSEMRVFPSEEFSQWFMKKPFHFPLVYCEPHFRLWSGGKRGEGVCTLLWHDLHRGGVLYAPECEDLFFRPHDDERHLLRKRLWHLRTEDDVVKAFGEPAFRLGDYREYDAEERKYNHLADCCEMLVYRDLIENCLTIIRVWEDGMVTALFSGFPKD